ncbi:MAG: type II secretion system F family protein [bacterium]|nr:type II secretion system F family protein [bacterium]
MPDNKEESFQSEVLATEQSNEINDLTNKIEYEEGNDLVEEKKPAENSDEAEADESREDNSETENEESKYSPANDNTDESVQADDITDESEQDADNMDEEKDNSDDEQKIERKKTTDKNDPETTSTLEKINDYLVKFQRIPSAEKLFFVQHLGVMVKAGISLSKSLQTLAEQTNNKRFKKILIDVSKRVEEGHTLAESLEVYHKIFTDLFINMISAGEVSGKLEEVLKQLYLQMKKDHELVSKIRSAMIYPSVILFAMGGIGTGMMIFIVPKIIDIFRGVNMELPLMTKILIAVSDAITNHGLIFGGVLLAIVIAFYRALKTYSGLYYWQWLILKSPVIGPIIKKVNLARFARTMSSLLKTDIKIVESFQITANTLGNLHYKKSLQIAADKIKKGEQIHEVLVNYPNLYSHVILQMINVGEETGELDSILDELAGFYEDEVKTIMETLPSIIEPLLILVLGVAIGGMAVAIIQPMYALTQAF